MKASSLNHYGLGIGSVMKSGAIKQYSVQQLIHGKICEELRLVKV